MWTWSTTCVGDNIEISIKVGGILIGVTQMRKANVYFKTVFMAG